MGRSTTGEEVAERPAAVRAARAVLAFLVSQWNLLTMGLLILLAYFFPTVGMTGGAVRAEYTVSWGGVGLIFLIAGLSLSISQLLAGLPHWRAHGVCSAFTFLISPALAFGFACAGRAAGPLDMYALAGLVVAGCLPTTIASNVSCTMAAGGSTELASIEVLLSNLIGTFVSPLLARMFLATSGWTDTAPGADGVTDIYTRMAKQLSITLIAPLLLGLLLQHCFPRPVAFVRARLHLAKVASLLTTLCVWHSFCNAFASGAFTSTGAATVIYVCFIGLALYLVLTALVLFAVRLPGVPGSAAAWWRMSKRDTIALAFCGPAKGVAVGSSVIAILYAPLPLETQAKLSLALVIYNGEQVACAQIIASLFRHWARDEIEADAEESDDDEKTDVVDDDDVEKVLPRKVQEA